MAEPESGQSAATPKSMGGCGMLGLIVAVPGYLLLLLFAMTFERRNPEDGMLVGFVMIGLFPVWIGLAGFLWAVTKQGLLAQVVAFAAWLLLVASAVASFLSLGIMDTNPNWLAIVPIALPVLFLMFGLKALHSPGGFASWRPAMGYGAAAVILLGAYGVEQWRDIKRTAEGQRQYEAEMARYEADFQANLRTATRLEQLLVHLNEESGRQTRALAAIRRLPSRQADAIRLLDGGQPLSAFSRLSEFDLQPTPELCIAYRDAFDRTVNAPVQPDPATLAELGFQDPNLVWLTGNGCDMRATLLGAADRLRLLDVGLHGTTADRLAELAGQPAAATPR